MEIRITEGFVRECWLGLGDHCNIHMACNVLIEPIFHESNKEPIYEHPVIIMQSNAIKYNYGSYPAIVSKTLSSKSTPNTSSSLLSSFE
jgi:hypothetical protein